MSVLSKVHYLASIAINSGSTDPLMKEIHHLTKPKEVHNKSIDVGIIADPLRKPIADYFEANPASTHKDKLHMGIVWHDQLSSRYYFRLRNLMRYLDDTKGYRYSRKTMMLIIRHLGGDNQHTTVDGQGIHITWLPASVAEGDNID